MIDTPEITEAEVIRLREQWFNKNYKKLRREVYHNIVKPTGPMTQYLDDLIHVSVIQFVTRTLEQQHQMLTENKVMNYILRTCSLNLRSGTSPFYNHIRKFRMSTSPQEFIPETSTEDEGVILEHQELYQCMQRELNKLNFYERTLIEEKFYNGLTYKEIRDKYDITLNSLQKDIKKVLADIKQTCECP